MSQYNLSIALKASISHTVIHAIVHKISKVLYKQCHKLAETITLDIYNKPYGALRNKLKALYRDCLLNLLNAPLIILVILPCKTSKSVKALYTCAVR